MAVIFIPLTLYYHYGSISIHNDSICVHKEESHLSKRQLQGDKMKAKILKKHSANAKDTKIAYLTADGHKALQEEYEDLVKNQRSSIAQRIQKAREYGDLSENAEYAEAKDVQSFIEGRILELEQILSKVSVIQNNGSTDIVQIGSQVKVNSNGKEVVFKIVGAQEANPMEKKISHESPLGQALLGKKAGQIVEFDAPVGRLNYKVVSIE